MTNCFSCGKDFNFDSGYKIGRKEECPHCGADAHVCLNCSYYDKAAYNECKEPSAERVLDKDRSNFCDYFQLRANAQEASHTNSRAQAIDDLEKLFK